MQSFLKVTFNHDRSQASLLSDTAAETSGGVAVGGEEDG